MIEKLCNCKIEDVCLSTHYTLCLTCSKNVSWETWISYWENKTRELKNEK